MNFDSQQTKVEFKLESTLHTVHGTFKLKSGTVKFDPSTGKASGAIVVDATSGESGNEGRDKKMHQEIIESGKYPEIVFTPKEIHGSINPAATSQVNVDGVIQLHGQDHDLKITVSIRPANGAQVRAETHFAIPYIKWGLKSPNTFLLKASDTVELDIQAAGQLAGGRPSR